MLTGLGDYWGSRPVHQNPREKELGAQILQVRVDDIYTDKYVIHFIT